MAKNDEKNNGPEETKKNNGDDKLLKAACKAYGIKDEHILASSVKTDGEVVIVTHGGVKVRWREGDKVEPLDPVRVDGIVRKKPKVVVGKKKSS